MYLDLREGVKRGDKMFPNLRKEMRILDVHIIDLARATGKNPKTISQKLNGQSEFTLKEIKEISSLFENKSYAYLFADGEISNEKPAG